MAKFCDKCGVELAPLQSFKWDFDLFKCYKKYDKKWLCDSCSLRVQEASKFRFFSDLLGEEYDEEWYVLRCIKADKTGC